MVMLMLPLFLSAQTVLKESDFSKSKTEVFTDSVTNVEWETKDGNKLKVYRSRSGAYYVWRTSKKTNKLYKYYLPKDAQVKLGRKYEK